MQELITIAKIIGGGAAGRIRGGMFNETVRDFLHKPPAWEIPNTIICGIWGIYIAAMLPLTWATPLVALIVGATAKIGYLKQVGEYFGFKSGFNLADKELRTWQNLSLLSVRGILVILPAYLCSYQLYPQLLGGVLAGMLTPLCYIIGFTIPEIKGKISHSQYGEWITYSTITAGILWPI